MKSNALGSSAIALGLFAVAGSQVFSSISNRQPAQAADVQPAAAVERVSMKGPGEPFIVWYDTRTIGDSQRDWNVVLLRAWSDGVIEARSYDIDGIFGSTGGCVFTAGPACVSPWVVISDPNEGRAAISDANGDSSVGLVDLNLLLANWGPSPRNDIPESPCSFGLIPG